MTTIASALYQVRKNEEWAASWADTAAEIPNPEDPAKPHPFAVEKAVNCTTDANEFWAKAVGLLLASFA